MGCFLIVAPEAGLARAHRLESRTSVSMCDPAGLLFDDLASDKNCQGMFAVVLRDMRGWQQMGSWLCIAGPLPILSQASAGSAIRSLLESYLLERWEWMDRYSVDRVLNYPRSHTHEGPEIHDRGIHDALHRELLNAM
jgi:hypothetical protein